MSQRESRLIICAEERRELTGETEEQVSAGLSSLLSEGRGWTVNDMDGLRVRRKTDGTWMALAHRMVIRGWMTEPVAQKMRGTDGFVFR